MNDETLLEELKEMAKEMKEEIERQEDSDNIDYSTIRKHRDKLNECNACVKLLRMNRQLNELGLRVR